jgi:hypothetical protein
MATLGLYVAGAASAGGVATYLATKLLRRPADPFESTQSTCNFEPGNSESHGDEDDHAATDDRIER